MRAVSVLIGTIVVIGVGGPVLAADPVKSGYAGPESRSIKALSEEDIAALRKGEGMGMAKAAELNGYPGPRHVLALARHLRLTESQASQVAAVRNRMSAAALPLGAELIGRERALDRQFAQGQITPELLTAETAAIGEILGRLRAVHLAAHLETRAILTAEQVAGYDKLRGYAGTGAPNESHSARAPALMLVAHLAERGCGWR